MAINDSLSIVVITAAFCSGVILGANIDTETEQKIRPKSVKWRLFSNATLPGLFLNQILWLLVVMIMSSVVAIGILHIGNAYPLCEFDRYTFVVSWFTGIGLAKWLRYYYWKSQP